MSTNTKTLPHTRWRITGTLTTRSPLHIGDGDATTFDHPALKHVDEDGNEELNEVQAIVRASTGKPCIPGTALKGVLRSWAEQMLPDQQDRLDRIFGPREIEQKNVEAGWAEFRTAFVVEPESLTHFAANVPYWNTASLTGILSHVCIDRDTGASKHNKLFFEEFVPEGIAFNVSIEASRLTEVEIQLLLAILAQGTTHLTHPLQFGANGADGWGHMSWHKLTVAKCDAAPSEFTGIGFDCCTSEENVDAQSYELASPAVAVCNLQLTVNGPFLVNDASRAKHSATKEHEIEEVKERRKGDPTNFTPLRREDGTVWLPASSLRGALRERCEFLLRSLNPPATGDPNAPAPKDPGPIERLFGHTGQRARLQINEPRALRPYTPAVQDFVAIDRFTGGAADGAKFDATYADSPDFEAQLRLNLNGLKPEDFALLRRALDDVCEGKVSLGWGGSKGYGEVTGSLSGWNTQGVSETWQLPESLGSDQPDEVGLSWLQSQLSRLACTDSPRPSSVPASTASSAQLLTGTLSVQQTKRGWEYPLSYVNDKGKQKSVKVAEGQVQQSLRGKAASQVEVEFEIEEGKQVRIRPSGEAWETSPAENREKPQVGDFAHPYYFLRMENRSKFPDDLKDARPAGHRCWQPGRYSGTLSVKLTVSTPLLIGDDTTVTADRNDHKTYESRVDSSGKPLLAASSIRGMLRAAYEAITNSRFGVFPGKLANEAKPAEKSGRRMGFRLPAQIQTVPARIVDDPTSPTRLAIELLPGTGSILPTRGAPLAAAWFGMYAGTTPSNSASVPILNGVEVWSYLTPWHYSRPTRSGGQITFDLWNVEEILPVVPHGAKPTTTPTRNRCSSRHAAPATWASPDWYRGFICVTQRNMLGKHDERFFFDNGTKVSAPLEFAHLQQWRQLIEDYQEQHKRELKQGLLAPPPLSRPNTFSRHVSTAPPALNLNDRDLKAGDLCYAEVEGSGTSRKVKGLYPVTISRKLYDQSPLDLLPESLRPAASIEQLSPADRVFGWVNQNQESAQGDAQSAYRSHVRIGPVTCETSAKIAIEEFQSPMTLAILGQPKPQQGRFYLGDKDGIAQTGKRSKEEAGYKRGNRIRGPKVYPHHKRAENYENPNQWATANRQAFSTDLSNQNRSVTGWVKPGTEFSFDLHVTNLSAVEIGALVWLLSLPAEHYLRLGLGKPLGFGSVRVEIDSEKTHIADGTDWIKSLVASTPPPPVDLTTLVQQFEPVINQANPDLLSAFKTSAAGLGNVPVHYPTTTGQSPGDAETYKWFVSNEKQDRPIALPDLTSDNPLLAQHPPA